MATILTLLCLVVSVDGVASEPTCELVVADDLSDGVASYHGAMACYAERSRDGIGAHCEPRPGVDPAMLEHARCDAYGWSSAACHVETLGLAAHAYLYDVSIPIID